MRSPHTPQYHRSQQRVIAITHAQFHEVVGTGRQSMTAIAQTMELAQKQLQRATRSTAGRVLLLVGEAVHERPRFLGITKQKKGDKYAKQRSAELTSERQRKR